MRTAAVGKMSRSRHSSAPCRMYFRVELGAESPLWDEEQDMVWIDTLSLPPQLVKQIHDLIWRANEECFTGSSEDARSVYSQLVESMPQDVSLLWDID